MKTTVWGSGLGTSFERDGISYLVSTIYRTEFGGYFQTMILRYPDRDVVYRIEVESQQEAVTEHIDAVAMAIAKVPSSWAGTKPYQDEVMEKKSNGTSASAAQEMPWTAPNIKQRIRAANIGYKEGILSKLFG